MFNKVVAFLAGLRSILNFFVHSIHAEAFCLLTHGLQSIFNSNFPGLRDDKETYYESQFADQLKRLDAAIEEGRDLIDKTPGDETDPVLVVDALFFHMNQALLVAKRQKLHDVYASLADGIDMDEIVEYYNDQHKLVIYCCINLIICILCLLV